jgi:hypothetical protein
MSFTTILLLLLVVGYSLYTKANKAAAARQIDGSEASDEEQDGVFSEEDPFQENGNEIFTYETEPETAPIRKVQEPRVRPMVPVVMEETPAAPKFDLRQAVIAQVILTNNYISEINQQNQ